MRSLALILLSLALAALVTAIIGVWKKERSQWLLAWGALTSAAFLSGHFLVFMVILFIGCAALAKRAPDRQPVLYAVLLPLIPTYMFVFGVPGINKIFVLDYTKILFLALLLPIYLASRDSRSGSPAIRHALDFFLFGYCVWVCFLTVVHRISVTETIRSIADVALFTLGPYLAVSRLVRTREHMRELISAIAFSGIVVACVCVVETASGIQLYKGLINRLHMEPIDGITYVQHVRFGWVRARGTMEGGLGQFAVFALGALLCLSKLQKISTLRLWLGIGMLAIPIVLSGSRGTWIMAGIATMTWIGFAYVRTPFRFLSAATVAAFAIPYLKSRILGANDQFGTFDYRERLVEAFLPAVWEKPVLGWGHLGRLYATGKYDHLIQGEGIIDMVNTFLGEALQRGVLGALLFFGIFIFGVLTPLRKLQRESTEDASLDYPVVRFICAVTPATAFILVTTSLVGHTWVYIIFATAIAGAIGAMPDSRNSDIKSVASRKTV